MRNFEKSSKLDNVLYDVRGPVVDEAARMEENGMEIMKLNIGNPAPFGFSAPEEVVLDMISSVRSSQGYSDSRGIFSARKAIMQYVLMGKGFCALFKKDCRMLMSGKFFLMAIGFLILYTAYVNLCIFYFL